MLENDFKIFINKINKKININDFNTIERNVEYSLRFELGDDLENRTKRVRQATKRAIKIFKKCFANEKHIYILTYDWADDFLGKTPKYLYKVLNNENFSSKRSLVISHYEGEKPEYAIGKLSIYDLPKKNIKIKKLFKGIANTDMGFQPCIHQIVYCFGKTTKKVFWMYDDRGCLIMTKDVKSMNPEFKKLKKWLCESYAEYYKKSRRKPSK